MKEYFILFTDIPDADVFKWEKLYRRAAMYISGRLKNGVDVQLNEEALCSAAAGCAYYEYVLLGAGAGTRAGEEIRVGDISLKNTVSGSGASTREAAEIRDHFLSACAGLIKSEGAVFLATGGDMDGV